MTARMGKGVWLRTRPERCAPPHVGAGPGPWYRYVTCCGTARVTCYVQAADQRAAEVKADVDLQRANERAGVKRSFGTVHVHRRRRGLF